MKNKDLKNLMKEYVSIQKELDKIDVEQKLKRQKELKDQMVQLMEDLGTTQESYYSYIFKYVKGYERKEYVVPNGIVKPKVQVIGGSK